MEWREAQSPDGGTTQEEIRGRVARLQAALRASGLPAPLAVGRAIEQEEIVADGPAEVITAFPTCLW